MGGLSGLSALSGLSGLVGSGSTPPTITSSAAPSVAENTTAVVTVAASGGQTPYAFSISGGADAALFSIDASTGALAFLVAPDYEAPGDAGTNNAYDVTVRVASVGGAYAEQSVVVTVTDVFEPSDLGLLAWFEVGRGTFTDAGTTPAVADDLIYRIPDLTGNGRHADQSTSGVRPQLKVVSGLPVARFASTDFMQFLSTITIPQNAGMEVMFVVQSADGANAIVLYDNVPNRQLRYGSTTNQLQSFDGSNFLSGSNFGTAISGNWHAMGWSVPASSSTLTFYEGTTARGTATFLLGSGDMTWDFIGTNTGPEYPQMDLAAIFIKVGQFTSQERADLVAYAATLHA